MSTFNFEKEYRHALGIQRIGQPVVYTGDDQDVGRVTLRSFLESVGEALAGDRTRIERNRISQVPGGTDLGKASPFASMEGSARVAREFEPMTVGKAATGIGLAFTGSATGVAAGTAGLPGDIVALGYGLWRAANPNEDEGRLNAFINGLSTVSETAGSEYFLNAYADWLEQNNVPAEQAQLMRQSADIGSIATLEAALVKAPKALKMGQEWIARAPERVAAREADTSVTLAAGVDPTKFADDLIVGAQSVFEKVRPGQKSVLQPPTENPSVMKLQPKYRVVVGGFEPQKGGATVPIKLTPNNSEKTISSMESIAQEFPDPLSSPDDYATMVARTRNEAEVSAPPSWMIDHANDPDKWADWFRGLTEDQITAAGEGLAVQAKFKDAYAQGAGAELTGHLMLWVIASRRMSAFPHEAGFLEIAEAADPFIKKAARGEWTDADTAAWREMSMSIQPEGSPGKSATSNMNAFGETFLKKMAAVDENGVSALERLHRLIADPNMSSADIRRQYYSLASDTGIGNKILSFGLLVSGRNDVVVLDRIQINRMWGGGEKIYDDIMMQFEGAQGLVQYEALERSLMTRVQGLYDRVGRPQDASVGRYHWESWVLSSGQIVSHPTLEAVVGMGTKRPGANISPTDLVPISEGRFHTKMSGVTYEKLPGGGNRFIYKTSDGKPYQFTRDQLDAMFDKAFSKKSGVLPADFPGVKAFEGGSIPWYEYEGVDRGKLDEIIRAAGKPKEDI